MEFFNNVENDTLKFKLNGDGVDLDNIEARLILTTKENKNYFFIGNIKNEICKFDLPELNLYEKGDKGKIKFEIISEDNYFPVWDDTFEIKSKASIKIEEMVSEAKSVKPTVVSMVVEKKSHSEERAEKRIDKPEKRIDKPAEKRIDKPAEKKGQKKIVIRKKKETSDIKTFENFNRK